MQLLFIAFKKHHRNNVNTRDAIAGATFDGFPLRFQSMMIVCVVYLATECCACCRIVKCTKNQKARDNSNNKKRNATRIKQKQNCTVKRNSTHSVPLCSVAVCSDPFCICIVVVGMPISLSLSLTYAPSQCVRLLTSVVGAYYVCDPIHTMCIKYVILNALGSRAVCARAIR